MASTDSMDRANQDKTAVRSFQVGFPQSELTELRRRVVATRWPSREIVDDRSQGVQLAAAQEVCRYWANEYDLGRVEARLNALPQFTTEIDGVDIHFLHVRSHAWLARFGHRDARLHRSAD
jgi:hypothetical protein